MKTLLQRIVFVLFVSLVTHAHTASAQDIPKQPHVNGQIVADYVDATAGINVKGTILVKKNPKKTPLNPQDLLIKLTYTSVTSGLKGHSFLHTRSTNQVREGLISDFLDSIPDLTPLRHQLPKQIPLKDFQTIASFDLHIVSKTEGSLSVFSDNQGQQNLIFHEKKATTSGLVNIVSRSLHKNDTSTDNLKLFLSFLGQFTKLASDLNCQNIWVTAEIGNRKEHGICWKNSFEAIQK